ncbi:hypothetical protein DX933_01140 [Ornithinibacillus gellani]|uniref:hypothetical protein n=1 Tax=Ornithinibacillus gellani TaxID=2293253 RepID=UPI000F4665E8|nr:hypothetical protein [Ornithinibacillus gellani]TQS76477.1 hypothetical protein DX933_01140 [Ornithinibacillus gellani]
MEHEHDHRHATISVAEKEDLLGLIHMRFGQVPASVREKIMAIDHLDVLDRLFLIAVNAANWDVFEAELNEGKDSFKITGDGFDPLAEKRGNQSDQ